MKFKIVTILFFSLISKAVFSHGMNKLGPNGGFIKMPGAFHTELIADGNQMKVYLLDIQFKNPITNDSSVTVKYIGKKEIKFKCTKNVDHFICDKPQDAFSNYREVILTTIRNKTNASEANYSLPLKLEK